MNAIHDVCKFVSVESHKYELAYDNNDTRGFKSNPDLRNKLLAKVEAGAPTRGPSFLLWNARNLMAGEGHKLHELQEAARMLQVPVVFVTETHLDPSFADGEIEMPGYEVLRQDRPGLLAPGGGRRGAIVY